MGRYYKDSTENVQGFRLKDTQTKYYPLPFNQQDGLCLQLQAGGAEDFAHHINEAQGPCVTHPVIHPICVLA